MHIMVTTMSCKCLKEDCCRVEKLFINQPLSMSKKVAAKPKLSFDMDEEEEEDGGGEGFQVKKSKESRKFKKMRQAPGIADTSTEPVAEKTVAHELGGSYSAESLAKLRQAQLFVAAEDPIPVEPTRPDDEPMELCGEAAEEFVEMTERLAMKHSQNLGEYVGFDGSADLDAIHAGRLNNKAILKGGPDRVYTSELTKPKKSVAFDLNQDNDSEWEEEIIRRGVISKTTALAEENKEVTARASRLPVAHTTADASGAHHTRTDRKPDVGSSYSNNNSNSSSSNSSSSVFGEIAVTDLLRSVQLAVDKLSANEGAARRRIEANATEVAQARAEESDLRGKVEIGVRKLNIVQDIKFFFASLVGMLREKGESLKELTDAVEACAREQRDLLLQRRVEEQEDVVFRLKEASLMVSLGQYTPTAILLAPQSASTDGVQQQQQQMDEFGRAKPDTSDVKVVAGALNRREDRRLRDRVRLLEVLPHVGDTDRELILANRLCDTSVEKDRCWGVYSNIQNSESGTCSSLFEELARCSALYNSRGEEVRLAEKLATLQQAALAVVDDAQPEMLSMSHILSMLEQFKAAYPVEYQAAYIGESVAELLAPLVALDLATLRVDMLSRPKSSVENASFRARPWFAPLEAYSQRSAVEGGAAGSNSDKSASRNSMQSMAAQINSLFAEEDAESDAKETLLSKVADTVLAPWLRDQLLPLLDPESHQECMSAVRLLKELQDLCSAQLSKSVTSAFVAHTERLFPEHALKVCLPLLKLGPSRGYEEQKSADSSSSSGSVAAAGVDFARAFCVHQLQRLRGLLANCAVFRAQKVVRAEAAAKCGWKALTEMALPCSLKLMRSGTIEDKLMVLTLCNASLTLVTGAQLEPRGGFAAPSSSSAGNTIHDGQLHAWKIPPAQFRPLLGAVKKLNEELSGLDSQRQECSGLFAELVQALNSCS